jgi:hypothetical protein
VTRDGPHENTQTSSGDEWHTRNLVYLYDSPVFHVVIGIPGPHGNMEMLSCLHECV